MSAVFLIQECSDVTENWDFPVSFHVGLNISHKEVRTRVCMCVCVLHGVCNCLKKISLKAWFKAIQEVKGKRQP